MFTKFFKRRSTQIVVLATAFVIGIELGHLGIALSLGFLIPAVLLVLVGHKKPLMLTAGLIAMGLITGIVRTNLMIRELVPLNSLVGQKIQLSGTVADDPTYPQDNRTSFHLSGLQKEGKPLAGIVTVRTHYIKLKRGYKVDVSGKLGTYYNQIQFSFADIKVTSVQTNWIEYVRQRFFAGMRSALPEPQASFALGLLLGSRALIPKALQEQLALVGLAHLVAVSGYNLTIIIEALHGSMSKVSRRLGVWLSLIVVGLFMLVTGFGASIVRAGIVALLSLWAHYYGRTIKPLALIGLAAVVTLVYRPSYLWSDLGWQLSFAAFFGILVLGPAIESRFIKRPHWLKSLVIQSVAAQIMTAPIIALAFSQFSVVAPLSNALLLPLVPLGMLLSLVAALAGIFVPALSGWLAWPAILLLQLMLAIVIKLASWNWSSLRLGLSAAQLTVSYLCIIAVSVIMLFAARRRQRSRLVTEAASR